MQKKQKIMLVVGEASGDAHAAKLVLALKNASNNTAFEFFGATGEKMREAGVETIVRADDFARVGILEVATALPMFLRVFRKVKAAAFERKPDVAVLVDFPDFNLKLATALKKKGIKVVYYISPQVWAWKKYRVRRMKSSIDLLLTILPFEKKWFAEHGFEKVEYVGNPLAGEVKADISRKEFCERNELDSDKPIVAFLPGSRKNEIERILPTMLLSASEMLTRNPDIQFLIPLASNRTRREVASIIEKLKSNGKKFPENINVLEKSTFDAVNAADVAAVASGTATLETAILGTPMAIVYKVSNLNYAVLKNFISVEHIGLVNFIAEKRLVAELIQNEFTPANLSKEMFRLLGKEQNQAMRNELAEIKEKLGAGGATEKAAAAITRQLEN